MFMKVYVQGIHIASKPRQGDHLFFIGLEPVGGQTTEVCSIRPA